jgi:magnesium-protoporphyrin O-methyltransferase
MRAAVPPCCAGCAGYEQVFDAKTARRQQKRYRKRGPAKETAKLRDLLLASGVRGASLLDVGGGVGALQHELVKCGVVSVVDVDASSGYLAAARDEAARGKYSERARFLHANFVEAAKTIPEADVVTLDKVICCYPDMVALVTASADKANRLYGFVVPKDHLPNRLLRAMMNSFMRLTRNPFRSYTHSIAAIDVVLRARGLRRRAEDATIAWRIFVYARIA